MLLITSGMLLLALVLAGIQACFASAEISRLPVLCAFRRMTGVPCPGCGLTRSWVALAGGHLQRSLSFHRMGWLVMLYVALQALRHGLWLLVPGMRTLLDRWGRRLDWGLLLLAILLFLNWFWTLAGRGLLPGFL